MDNNSDEQRQRHHELNAASTWLADAREWVGLATKLHAETNDGPDNNPTRPNKLNVVHASLATAFRLGYNALLVAEAKWPRENDNLEMAHRRLQGGTQDEVETFIARARFNDTNRLLKNLDYYLHNYMVPTRELCAQDGSEQDAHQDLQIPSSARLIEELVVCAEHKITDAKNASPPTQLNSEEALAKVLEKIQEIVRASVDGDYIYRGESQYFDKISSNLYRHYEPHIQSEHFKIEDAQDEMLKEAEGFVEKTSDFELLTQLQHFGGKTNLIDFSTDYLVALYFACDGSHDENGRIFLLEKTEKSKNQYGITTAQSPFNRVISQKSVFVRPPDGFIVADHEIVIPACLKRPVLDYLRKHHGIATNNIYNDIHGFIKYQDLHQSAYVEFVKGLQHYSNGNYQEAVRHYNEAERRNPQLSEVYNNRGVIHDKLGSYGSAIKDFDSAIELRPDDGTSYSNRGMTYCRMGEHNRGIQDYDEATKLNPLLADAYYNRGIAYNDIGDFKEAIANCTVALGIDPQRADALNTRGLAYEKAGLIDSAIADYTRAIELNPEQDKPRYNRGLLYLQVSKYDDAITDFTAAIGINNDDFEAYKNRGKAHFRKGEHKRAVQDYDKAINLNPDSADTLRLRAVASFESHDFRRAITDLTKAIDLQLESYETYNVRGVVYYQSGDLDLAINDFSKAIEIDSKLADAHRNRGAAFFLKGRYEDAIRDLDAAIGLDPSDPDTYKHRGLSCMAVDRHEDAIDDFDKALELNSGDAETYVNRGWAHFSTGEYSRAVQDYSTGIALQPGSSAAYGNRALAFMHMHNWSDAKSDLTAARNLGSDIVAACREYYPNLSDLEESIGASLPVDIAEMLG